MAPSWVIYGDEPQPGPGPKSAISPTDIAGLELWLDAADPASVTLVGGTDVSQWADKSGNGRHAIQSTSGLRPQYALAQHNGRNMIDYISNLGRYLDIASISVSQPFTIFGFAQTSAVNQGAIYVDVADLTGANRILVQSNETNNHYGISAGQNPTGSSNRSTKYTAFIGVFNGDNTFVTANSRIYINDVLETVGNVGSRNMVSMRIGIRYSADSAYHRGYAGELGIYNSVINGTDLTNLTYYLMNKWAPDV